MESSRPFKKAKGQGATYDGTCFEYGGNSHSNIPFALLRLANYLQLHEAKNKNFVFSPGSIQLALSLLTNGSKGETLKELLIFLDAKDLNYLNLVATEQIDLLTGTTNGGADLSFVGGVWVDQSLTLKSTFETIAVRNYKARAQVVDFRNEADKITAEVNKWAEEATNGLIQSVLSEDLNPSTVMVLANAVYFRGTWSQKFDKSYTKNQKFYLPDGLVVSVPFLTSHEDQFVKLHDDFKVLRLPYERSVHERAGLSMYIFLPNEKDGFWPLVEKVGSDPLFLHSHLNPYGAKVIVNDFRLPKFKMTYEFEASDILRNLGLKSCFSDEAEFGEMVVIGALKVTDIFHKALIEVNEEGTEAAAATVSVMQQQALLRPQLVDFVADHPFMFVVRHDGNGMVLFMGHVINPLA